MLEEEISTLGFQQEEKEETHYLYLSAMATMKRDEEE